MITLISLSCVLVVLDHILVMDSSAFCHFFVMQLYFFHHILVVHFWYTSWSFLCWVLLLVSNLLATHFCCFSMLPCYVLLLLLVPLCSTFLLVFVASSIWTHVVLQRLLIVCSYNSSMLPCCVLLMLFNVVVCSSAPLCYVLWLLFNPSLLCSFSLLQRLFVMCFWCSSTPLIAHSNPSTFLTS